MPRTDITVFRDSQGEIEFNEWYASLKKTNLKAYVRCQAALLRLERDGFDLRRPAVDILRDGIWELRVKVVKVNYRILYGFHGKNAVCLSHGLTKEGDVPDKDIDKAASRLKLVKANPQKHIAQWER